MAEPFKTTHQESIDLGLATKSHGDVSHRALSQFRPNTASSYRLRRRRHAGEAAPILRHRISTSDETVGCTGIRKVNIYIGLILNLGKQLIGGEASETARIS